MSTWTRVRQPMSFKGLKRTALLAIGGAVTALVAAACTVAAQPTATPVPPTPTPVPTPTPTPTPTPVPLTPIRIDPKTDPLGFLNAMPSQEVACMAQAAGSREKVVGFITGKSVPDEKLAAVLAKCVSGQTMLRVFTGQVELATGPLSDTTLQCVAGRSAGLNISAMLLGARDPAGVIPLLQAMFCLNKDERSKLAANPHGFALSFGGARIDAVECFVNKFTPTKLLEIFRALEPGPAALAAMPEYFTAVLDCGLVDDADLRGSGFTAAQMSCLSKSAGPDFAIIFEASRSGRPPDFAKLAQIAGTLQKCGVDLKDIAAAAGLAPPPGLPQIGLTPEQVTCLTGKIGPDVFKSIQSGALDVSKLLPLVGAISSCGIDASKLLAQPPR